MAKVIPRHILPLDGVWSYRKDTKRAGEKEKLYDPARPRKGWEKMRLPANWYKTKVGDYHGVIWFAREFRLPQKMKCAQYTLRFEGVDYIAEVWLNGHYLGRHEGFFAPFEFSVGKYLKSGTNTLIVKVDSPFDETEYRLVPDDPGFARPLTEPFTQRKPVALTVIKGSCIDFWHRPGWHTQFGQDGNTGGIWKGVKLIGTGTLKIDKVKIYPKLVERDGVPDGTALLAVDVDIYNSANQAVTAEVGLEARGKNFKSTEKIKKKKQFVLTPGANRVKLVHTVKKPRLWWCWDHGKPNLYEMKITAATDKTQDETTETFGIREMQLDEKGHWWLNGKRVFARGMRYHSSIWLGEGNEKLFAEDLKKIRSLDINAIRIGSHVEKDRLYEMCDEMGFMVWQVFPMHWGAYADTDDVIERAAPMMREMVEMLYNHPSIVIWSTFKEPNVYPFKPAPNLFGRLCQIMYETARTVDPIRWVHRGDYEEGAQNVMTGGWGEKYIDFRRHVNDSPQKVEYGTVAMCPIKTAKEILKPEEQWPPVWNRWFYLNLDPLWLHLQDIDPDKMAGLEETIEASQTWSARQIKESIEFLRQRKYAPTASMFLYFFSDPWPCLGGSGLLDYYRRKYKSYDIFGMVYTPVLASIEWVKDKHFVGFEKSYRPGETLAAKLWVTNDKYEKFDAASLAWRIKDDKGKVLKKASLKISIPEDSSQIVKEVSWPIPKRASGLYRMEVELKDKKGKKLSHNYFEFRVTREKLPT